MKPRSWIGNSSLAIAMMVSVGTLGCKTNGDDTAATGTSTGSTVSGLTSVGTVSNSGFYVNATLNSNGTPNPEVQYYFHEQSANPLGFANPTTPNCIVTSANFSRYPTTANPLSDIFCILDVGEYDLYFNSLSLNVNAPVGACNYVMTLPYTAFNYPPANYGSNLQVMITANELSTPTTYTYQFTYPALAPGTFPPGLMGTVSGGLDCTSDFTSLTPPGPNACQGTIGVQSCTTTSNGTSCTGIYVPTPLGGKVSAALSGPGMNTSAAGTAVLDPNGFPEPYFTASLANGANFSITMSSPTSLQKKSNLYVANFWNPADVLAGTPGQGFATPSFFDGAISLTGPNPSNLLPPSLYYLYDPLGLHNYTGGEPTPVIGLYPQQAYSNQAPPVAGSTPNPYYLFGCVDAAGDFIARIRVLVRSWDTVAGWTSYANPYSSGPEPIFDDPVHDKDVWGDYLTAYPGPNF